MPAATQNRAAVFATDPQAVEVFRRGAWWPGALLGWRHDSHDDCQVWVRVETDRGEETVWTSLDALRLPEAPSGRHPVAPAGSSGEAGEMRGPAHPRRGAGARDLSAVPDVTATQHLPLLRERAGVPGVGRGRPSAGGRRRAPEVEVHPGTAPAAVPAIAPTGPLPGSAEVAESAAAGRHRAPAPPGKHRAADTGVLPAVGGPAPAGRASSAPAGRAAPAAAVENWATAAGAWTPPPPRTPLPPAGPVVRPGRSELAAPPLTRPMRLDEGAGSLRRPRRDTLSGI